MVKRIGIGILMFLVVVFMGTAAQAVPSLGVGTGTFDCSGATAYYQCFSGNSASGAGESFMLPATGTSNGLTLWSNIMNVNLYLVAEQSIGLTGFSTGSASGTSNIQVDGYTNTPYNVWSLGTANSWASFPADSPFDTGQDDFRYRQGTLTYSGTGSALVNHWVFLYADVDGDGILNEAGGSRDTFSPKTTSAVPEPGTVLLLGAGLVGIGVCRRKFAK